MILNYKFDAAMANEQTVRAMTHTFFRKPSLVDILGKQM
jgi:iron complex outermembrane receptor protein